MWYAIMSCHYIMCYLLDISSGIIHVHLCQWHGHRGLWGLTFTACCITYTERAIFVEGGREGWTEETKDLLS